MPDSWAYYFAQQYYYFSDLASQKLEATLAVASFRLFKE